MKYLAFFLLALVPCCGLHAQVTLTETKVHVYDGLKNPRLVDGVVFADADSEPKLTPASVIGVQSEVKHKYVDIEAERIPDLAPVDMQPTDGGYLLKDAGTYRVTYLGFEPGLVKKRLMVTISGDPQPIDPPDDKLSVLSKSSRDAMAAFVVSMAGNFDTLAAEAKTGNFKTINEASGRSNILDLDSRRQFKEAMAKIMEPKLGNTQLPADADKTFSEIAIGFKAVK